jgi:hypothetical protein
VDDTPEVITVSCFDPIRREIARRTLEYLVKDGRIQPGRIEEVVAKCKKEVDESTQKYGEEAAFKLGLPKINRELLNYVGRLHYRTSYGQNALDHSMEVAYLTGIMAAELGLDQSLPNALVYSTISASRSTSSKKAPTSNSAANSPANTANPMSSSIRSNRTMAMLRPLRSSLTSSLQPIPYRRLVRALVLKPLKPTLNVSINSRPSPKASTVWLRLTPYRPAVRSASWSSLIKSAMPMPS